MDPTLISRQANDLTRWLEAHRDEALARFNAFMPGTNLGSFHAQIGRNNNTFVDSVRTQFAGPEAFVAQWVDGLNRALDEIRAAGKVGYKGRMPSEEVVFRCLQDPVLATYTFKFLERNFYRHHHERTRAKPDEALWSVWFGQKDAAFGLLVAPTLRQGEWTNDKSQMRRERYTYWTIGHVMEVGLIDSRTAERVRFESVASFADFYRREFKEASASPHERAIHDLYLDHLVASSDPALEPLLIPEFRYAGNRNLHKYRLDFTVLNGHTFEFTGFELSPASTHIRVEDAEKQTPQQMNAKLRAAWEYEVTKRNDYFGTFGIPVVTFADSALRNTGRCFDAIKTRLVARSAKAPTLDGALESLLARHGHRIAQASIG
jgi:hypothetical protein